MSLRPSLQRKFQGIQDHTEKRLLKKQPQKNPTTFVVELIFCFKLEILMVEAVDCARKLGKVEWV